jgi:hypothetical protein
MNMSNQNTSPLTPAQVSRVGTYLAAAYGDDAQGDPTTGTMLVGCWGSHPDVRIQVRTTGLTVTAQGQPATGQAAVDLLRSAGRAVDAEMSSIETALDSL